MVEGDSYHLANITVIIVAGKNHGEIITINGQKYHVKQSICTISTYLPIGNSFIMKGK